MVVGILFLLFLFDSYTWAIILCREAIRLVIHYPLLSRVWQS